MQRNRWIDIFHPPAELPEDMLVEIQWFNTNWCNNKCPYCPQNHKREDGHSFDLKSPLEWAEQFNKIQVPYYLYVTGGESLLDIKSFTEFYNAVIDSPFLKEVRIDTNCTMPAKQLEGMHVKKTILMTSYHPSALTIEKTAEQIKSYEALGFGVSMVNFVCRAEQVEEFKGIRGAFLERGISATAGIYFGQDARNDSRAIEAYETVIDKLDIGMKTGIIDPFGLPCRAGAHYLMLDCAGQLSNCWGEWESFFSGTFTVRAGSRPCPKHQCGCIDAYSMLEFTGREPGEALCDYVDSAREKTKIVLVCGYFGFGNFGDELLLDAMIEKLRQIPGVLPIILGVGDKSGIIQRHGLPFYMLGRSHVQKTAKLVSLCDAVIVGPGGLIQEFRGDPVEFYSINGSHHYLHPAVLAQLSGKPSYGVGLGSDSGLSQGSARGYRLAMQGMDLIYARDEETAETLRNTVGLNNLRLSGDFAYAYPVKPREKRPPSKKPVVGINLRAFPHRENEKLFSMMADAMLQMMKAGWLVRLVLLDLEDEKQPAEVLQKHFERFPITDKQFETVKPESVEDKLEEIRDLDLFICMRLHGNLLAARMGVPFIALAYHEKVREQVRRLGMAECMLDPYQTSAGELMEKAQWILKNQETLVPRQLECCQKQEAALERDWLELREKLQKSREESTPFGREDRKLGRI